MTQPMSSEQLQNLLAGYVLYDLSPEESATLAALQATDPSLQQEIEQLQHVLEIAYSGEPVSAPAHLRQAVLRVANAAKPAAKPAAQSMIEGRLEPDLSALPTVRSPRWRLALGAAAAALIAGLGLSNMLLWRSLQLERAQQPSSETITVSLDSPSDSAQAQVVIDPDTLEGSLAVENLPPLQPGSVYVLWTVLNPNAPVTADPKNAILTTVFTVDEQGNGRQPIDLPAVYRHDPGLVKAVAITQEKADAPQAHQSPPILIQPL